MSCAKHSYDFDGSLDLVIAPHVVTPISAPFSTGSAVILALCKQPAEVARRLSGFIGKFDDEIVPVPVKVKKEMVDFVKDEGPRPGTTAESLSKLRCCSGKEGGLVTAGNASGINDGAAAIVVMSEEKAKELGVTPMATWVAGALGGVEPEIMGVGPVASTKKVLAKTGLSIDDFDLIEANEAFAAHALRLASVQQLGPPSLRNRAMIP